MYLVWGQGEGSNEEGAHEMNKLRAEGGDTRESH